MCWFRFPIAYFLAQSARSPSVPSICLCSVQKKQKKLAKVNGDRAGGDAFDEHLHNDDDVARIARELERKYGNAYAGKNCGKNSAGGACYDKGTGYDESDSFIDNTDAVSDGDRCGAAPNRSD